MSSVKLENLIAEFPAEKTAVRKLVGYFEQLAQSESRPKYFSYDRIYTLAAMRSSNELVLLLHRLVQSGLLEQIIRVENNSAGIGDFPDLKSVPNEIYDDRLDTHVLITPDKLHLYYKLHPQVKDAG
jgi:hypothetical protein